MSNQLDTKQEARIKKLEWYWSLSSYLIFCFAIELLLILAGIVNLAMNGLGDTHGLTLLLIGTGMAVAHILWVKKVRAFLDEKSDVTGKKPSHLKIVK